MFCFMSDERTVAMGHDMPGASIGRGLRDAPVGTGAV